MQELLAIMLLRVGTDTIMEMQSFVRSLETSGNLNIYLVRWQEHFDRAAAGCPAGTTHSRECYSMMYASSMRPPATLGE